MSPRWEDLTARARGLRTHLLPEDTLARLAESGDLASLGRNLEKAGVPVAGAVEPLALELALRRWAAAMLDTLWHWLGHRVAWLRAWLELEDRRSLRAMIRGAMGAVPPAARLDGLIPTPLLPERLLQELARQPAPAQVAAVLAAIGHPYGSALLEASGGSEPDLLRIELALDRTYAARAVDGARSGGAELRQAVARRIDRINAVSALILARADSEIPPEAAYLPGGARLTRERFIAAVASGHVTTAAAALSESFEPEVRELLQRYAASPRRLESALSERERAEAHRAMLRNPVGPAMVLTFLLDLRHQYTRLGRIVWGVALGTPPELIRASQAEAA